MDREAWRAVVQEVAKTPDKINWSELELKEYKFKRYWRDSGISHKCVFTTGDIISLKSLPMKEEILDIYIEFEVIVVLCKPHDYILNTIRLIPCSSINETFSSHICISFYLPIPTGQFLLVGLFFPSHVLLLLYPVQMYHFFFS